VVLLLWQYPCAILVENKSKAESFDDAKIVMGNVSCIESRAVVLNIFSLRLTYCHFKDNNYKHV